MVSILATSPHLENALEDVTAEGYYHIICDLRNVNYISSAGWGIFVSKIKMVRDMGGDLVLSQMIPDVYDVFKLLEKRLAEADFQLIALTPELSPVAMEVSWELNRVTTRYQWYSTFGNWNPVALMLVIGVTFVSVLAILILKNHDAQKVKQFNIVFSAERPFRPHTTHFAWNFFQGQVFGWPVSGVVVPSLLQTSTTGPEWITGGGYGPEGGAEGFAARFVVLAALFGWFKLRSPERSWKDILLFRVDP